MLGILRAQLLQKMTMRHVTGTNPTTEGPTGISICMWQPVELRSQIYCSCNFTAPVLLQTIIINLFAGSFASRRSTRHRNKQRACRDANNVISCVNSCYEALMRVLGHEALEHDSMSTDEIQQGGYNSACTPSHQLLSIHAPVVNFLVVALLLLPCCRQ
jgi:hypothetical protein